MFNENFKEIEVLKNQLFDLKLQLSDKIRDALTQTIRTAYNASTESDKALIEEFSIEFYENYDYSISLFYRYKKQNGTDFLRVDFADPVLKALIEESTKFFSSNYDFIDIVALKDNLIIDLK